MATLREMVCTRCMHSYTISSSEDLVVFENMNHHGSPHNIVRTSASIIFCLRISYPSVQNSTTSPKKIVKQLTLLLLFRNSSWWTVVNVAL